MSGCEDDDDLEEARNNISLSVFDGKRFSCSPDYCAFILLLHRRFQPVPLRWLKRQKEKRFFFAIMLATLPSSLFSYYYCYHYDSVFSVEESSQPTVFFSSSMGAAYICGAVHSSTGV